MPLPDILPIKPFTQPVRGEVSLPGSKSLTNRALILASLCQGPVVLSGALFSEDTQIMTEALVRLGFDVKQDERRKTIQVEGQGGKIPAVSADIFVGNAGTAARFLTALCAAARQGVFTLDGIPQMRRRPMKGLIDALRSLGADIRCLGEEGFLPVEIRARGLRGGKVRIDARESSQMLSALLMVAPLAGGDVVIGLKGKVREPFVELTRKIMHHFGVDVGDGFKITGHEYFAKPYPIEPDATAASYFLALPLVVNGSLTLRHFTRDSLQGDAQFADALKGAGLSVEIESAGSVASHEAGPRKAVRQNFKNFSDTFLTLAAISPLLEGQTLITGIGHTRKQETDRVGNMAKELTKLGQRVSETEDSLEIHPQPLPRSGKAIEIETYGDHRFAMSFGILGCHDLHADGRPWLAIRDPGCCAKTFPDFFELLEDLRRKSSEADAR